VTSHSNLLTRRKAVQGAIALVGGTVAATQLGSLVSTVSAMDSDYSPQFLSSDQFAMVEQIVDMIIPETDTPGAKTAGVHRFIDMMLAEWASPATKTRFVEGLQAIDARAQMAGEAGFFKSAAEKQLEILEVLDAEAFAGNGGNPFFRELKKFVLFGYYSSEEGASVELRYDRLPGAYRGCVPLEDIGRSWSNVPF
jgi:gluconate 2-dehydrogenase gamma chain